MARPREFDLGDALRHAMDVFWERGYEAASLSELLAAMGIAKGSLYKAFTDKRSVYLAALAHYNEMEIKPAIAALRDNKLGDGSKRILACLLNPSAIVERAGGRHGCFMCNAAIDMSPKDAEVEALVRQMMDDLKTGFLSALQDSNTAKYLTPVQRKQAAQSLLATYMGLHVLAKAGYGSRDLAAIARDAVSSIGSEPCR
jgi:TetR/AcrR family transcriptional repressor of nem operon